MKAKVGLIDYDSGNFSSVCSAFKQQECEVQIIQSPEHARNCTHIVLPGVGAFSVAMDKLQRKGLLDFLREIIDIGQIPILGICVGMQILAENGEEFSFTEGLGAVSGVVEKFDFADSKHTLHLPHMGWNDVIPNTDSRLFKDFDPEDMNFYFVHSYRMVSHDPFALFSFADYGERFIAAFEKGNVFGVQFHPEKSQRNGHLLLKNFIKI